MGRKTELLFSPSPGDVARACLAHMGATAQRINCMAVSRLLGLLERERKKQQTNIVFSMVDFKCFSEALGNVIGKKKSQLLRVLCGANEKLQIKSIIALSTTISMLFA